MSVFINNPLRTGFKEIEKKANYKKIKDTKTFLEAEKKLDNWKVYKSLTAEKRRYVRHKAVFKLNPKTSIDLYNKLVKNYLLIINKNINFSEIDKLIFVTNTSDGTIRKLHSYKKNQELIMKWIDYDSIYIFTLILSLKSSKNESIRSAKLKVRYSVKLPVTMDYYSYQGLLGRMDFKAHFKNMKKQIKAGIRKEEK